jgi:spoIIIJ-associated protein
MKVRARVTAEYGQAEDARSRIPVRVNINGDDLSILIGRQAETLNALQYIASLIISKEIGQSIPLVVDVEGYRSRRENQLRQLARRMADQAIKSGRRQVLEPMPANERRVIHIELKNNPEVTTESVGEEPHRKITILPK